MTPPLVFVGSIVEWPKQLEGPVVTVNALLNAVCVVYNLSLDEIASGRRLASEARSMSTWIALETTGCTIAQLAAARKESRVRDQRGKILQLIARLHA